MATCLSASKSIRARLRRGRRTSAPLLAAAAQAAGLAAGPAAAHGFGQRYELPLPLPLYLLGGAAVVALSFIVFSVFVRGVRASARYPRRDLATLPLGRTLAHPIVATTLKLATLGLFLITVLAGLLGDQNPYRNIAPTMVWIVWWVGFAYLSAFLGDLWRLVSPWRTVFDAVDRLHRRRRGGIGLACDLPYPQALGAWPACALLLAFSWVELVYPDPAVPAHLAYLAIAYSLLTWSGMVLFGRDRWLERGEPFALFFGLFARLAPTEWRDARLYLRPPGAGFLDASPLSTSKTAFVLLMLACVLFDGLIGTPEWANLESALRAAMPGAGDMAPLIIRTAGLMAFWLIFLSAFLGISAVMSTMASRRPAPFTVARSFALTLVPIAIGYHVAHYLVYLLLQGQYIIPLASDPFGYGWNLFSTAGYRVDIALAGARFTWYLALAAIVLGHVAAVYLAHLRAFTVFADSGAVLRTQIPLTALMVVYTFVGLSITAEPIVESRIAQPTAVTAEAAIPADALIPDVTRGFTRGAPGDRVARLKLSYKALGSAFHDGTKTAAADIIYAFAFAYRWSGHGGDAAGQDALVAAATAAMREHLVALRVTNIDTASKSFRVGDVNFVRELFTVEVYLDLPADDLDWNAAVAPPFSTLPWHLLVLMEEAVRRGWAAFSQEEAQRRKVPWLDLVRSGELIVRLAALAAQFEREAYRPEALRALVSDDEARKRWAALGAFYNANGHLLVANGPYVLKRWSQNSATLAAFRDLSYPLGVGSYDAYAIPRRGFITGVEWSGTDTIILQGDIENVEKFQRSYRLVRTPLPSLSAVVIRRAAPECRYVVADATGRIVVSGSAAVDADGKFRIGFKDRLPAGKFLLSAFIAVDGNAINPDIRRIPISIAAGP
jgi:hypothetical protein